MDGISSPYSPRFSILSTVILAVILGYKPSNGHISSENAPNIISDDVHILSLDTEIQLHSYGHNRLVIFCYPGEARTIVTLLKTVELVINVPKENFYYYEGANASEVRSHHQQKLWISFSPWRPRSFRLDIYNNSCVGIDTKETFAVRLEVRHVDLWRVLALGLGVGLFAMAPLLAHNVLFHYATGVSIGVIGSLLVVIFFLSRFIPKKTGALTVLLGGWGLVLYAFQYFWNNFISLIKEFKSVVAGYVVLSGLISFCVVYRMGPLSDERSLRLVQWAMQLAALCLIFFSSQCKEFSLAVVLCLLFYTNIPTVWKCKVKSYWLRRFPPKPKLLTEEEYLEESRVETKKALAELREFCHSPECNSWRTISRLKTPQRFAEFVDGGFHLSDEEILDYESSATFRHSGRSEEDLFTSDED